MRGVEGFILVGGASRRMGADKSRLSLGGRQFVERVSDALGAVAVRVRLVGAQGAEQGLSLQNVPDVYAGWGALGGLHAALAACEEDWAAVVACDLPFVTGRLFERLCDMREGSDAVVPVQADGRRQPLCAIYRVGICLERARGLIEAGERRPRALLDKVRTRFVAAQELADIEGAANFFSNINTPEDYERAKGEMIRDEG
ncbi:MAG TPA: molybdenum cofactor guanylyltransferase [Pyrinomonadaceae bacterium]